MSILVSVNDGHHLIDAETFIDVVYHSAFQRAVTGSVEVFKSPPGRRPSAALLQLHDWFVALSEEEQVMVQRAMAYAAEGAIFGVLAMIDNVRPVVDGFKEELSLRVVSPSGERQLASEGEELHGLFRSRVDEESGWE